MSFSTKIFFKSTKIFIIKMVNSPRNSWTTLHVFFMFIQPCKKFSTGVAFVGKTVRYFICATGISIRLWNILCIIAQKFFSVELIGLYITLIGSIFFWFFYSILLLLHEVRYIFQLYSFPLKKMLEF